MNEHITYLLPGGDIHPLFGILTRRVEPSEKFPQPKQLARERKEMNLFLPLIFGIYILYRVFPGMPPYIENSIGNTPPGGPNICLCRVVNKTT